MRRIRTTSLPHTLASALVAGVVSLAGLAATSPPAAAADAFEIFVSPTGDDAAAGSSTAPVASLAEAQSRVRAALVAGNAPVTVVLGDGVYSLAQTLTMDERDSGAPGTPVTWKAAEGSKPVISGGRQLEPAWSTYAGQIKVADIGSVNLDQLYVDGARQTLARYPNYDPAKRLGGYAPDAIDPTRVATWSNPLTAQVRGLQQQEWGGNSYTVTGKNADGTLALKWVGDNQRGSGLHATYRMVENVFEELDSPGEWFYDKTTGKLYYWPANGVDLSTASLRTAELDELVRVQGASPESPAHDITITGITFTQTHRTLFDSTYEPISLSDWAIVRKAAVAMKNTAGITIKQSVFDQIGGNGVFIDGYGKQNTVNDNVFTAVGASPVAVVGSETSARQASTWGREQRTLTDTAPGPATEDYPREITISNNLMKDFGLFEKQTAAVQISRAFRVTATHNTIHDGPRAGINIGDGTFGGHRISHNDLWNLVEETGDHGPINSWGRDRFWPVSNAGDAQRKAWSTLDHLQPNVIENNRIWHHSDWAVDLDDGSSNYIVRNNLLLNSGTKFREGFNRTSANNIYVGGAAHFHVSYADNGDQVSKNIFLNGAPYRFIQADPQHSKISHDNNVFWNNGSAVGFAPYGADLTTWQQSKGLDQHSIVASPQFVGTSPWVDPAKTDYTVQDGSPALARGFVNIEMGAFGRPGSTDGPPPVSLTQVTQTATREGQPEPLLGATSTGIYSAELASSVGRTVGDGLYLQTVPEGTAAATAGLRSADVIFKVNGATVTDKNSFWRVWNKIAAGSAVTLDVWRNQAPVTITLSRPAGVEKINNTSGVTYTGAGWDWKNSARGGARSYLDDIDASNVKGDSFALSFEGTRLAMYTQTNTDEAQILISVDGGPEQAVSLVTPSRVFQGRVFDTGELPSGQHTIVARSATAAWFIVDAFEITRSVQLHDSTTTLGTSAPSQVFGATEPVTLTATVASNGGTVPTGAVEFAVDGTAKATVEVDASGKSAWRLDPATPAGTHRVTARYLGSPGGLGSTSDPIDITVTQAISQTTLTASGKTQKAGSPVTLTARIMIDSGYPPNGLVEILVDGQPFATVAPSDGVASYTFAAAVRWKGAWSISAVFHPDAPGNVAGSTTDPISIRFAGKTAAQ